MATPVAKCSEYRGRRQLIDHVLASHELVAGELPTVTTVCCGSELPSMEDRPDARRNEPGSDHAAITATFQVAALQG